MAKIQAYSEPYPWEEILPPELYHFLCTVRDAKCCPVILTMGALLPMVSMVLGPSCSVDSGLCII